MTDRAALLELIDRAPGSLHTLQGRWHSWAHAERAEAAQARAYGRPTLRLSAGNPGPGPTIIEGTSDVWLEPPDHWRVVSDGPPLNMFILDISDGRMRWTGSLERLTEHDRSNTMAMPGPPLVAEIHAGPMLGWASLGDPTPGEHEGRPVWIVAAHERVGTPDRIRLPADVHLLPGAEHEYSIDAQTGIVVSHAATIDGELCLRSELTGLAIDEPLDPALFRPPGDAEVTSETDQHLAMLEAGGVDTTGLDRTDPTAVRAALQHWMQSLHSDAQPQPPVPPPRGSRARPPDPDREAR